MGWKVATFALTGLVVAQFLWWNKKAPQVLNLGGAPALPPQNGNGTLDQLRNLGAEPRFGNNWLT